MSKDADARQIPTNKQENHPIKDGITEYIKYHLSDDVLSLCEAILPQCNPPRKLNIIAPYKCKANATEIFNRTSTITNITAKPANGIIPEYPNIFAHFFSIDFS